MASQAPKLHQRFEYKWIALSNTTLGVLMASINMTIMIISLPAIFHGLDINPLKNTSDIGLLLWILLGFNVATTVLLVTFGRLSDSHGRVRLYNMGFAVFTLGSIMLFLTPGTGLAGEWELIIGRFIQGIGGAFLFANSAAILTDAFPADERGLALGLNQVAAIGGSVIGLILGGVLSVVWWRLIFLVSIPVGVVGTVWAYIALREIAKTRVTKKIDIWGNLTFGVGVLGILVGLTYGIMPYGGQMMGWTNPLVRGGLIVGTLLLLAFIWIESRTEDPMFHLEIFRNRAFTAGNIAGLLGSIARGGLSFMLIIWLQGIWLPLHGVSYHNTPLLAGIDIIPQMVGFLLLGPLSGILSDRFGARWLGMFGMILSAIGFYLLNTLPANFPYWLFAFYIFLIGAGMGMFSSPNTSAIMSSVSARFRGVASGMRATFQNAGMMFSMGIFFSIVIGNLAASLPSHMQSGLISFGLPAALAAKLAHEPPTFTLFSALLGYNPFATLIPASVLHTLPAQKAAILTGRHYFPSLIGPPFMKALRVVFLFSMGMSLVSAGASALRGKRYIHEEEEDEEDEEQNGETGEQARPATSRA